MTISEFSATISLTLALRVFFPFFFLFFFLFLSPTLVLFSAAAICLRLLLPLLLLPLPLLLLLLLPLLQQVTHPFFLFFSFQMDFLKVLFFFALFFSLLQSRRPRLPKENHSPQPNQHNSSSPSPPPLSFTFVEPPNPRVNISEGSSLFYLHIAKTGGHTVNSVLSRVQNPSPYSPNEPGYFKKVCKDQEKMKHTLVFSKEIEFQAVAAQLKNIPTEEVVVQNKTVNRTECFSQRFLFFSVLRDPVTWLDSAWSHACSSPVRYNDANFTAICRSGNVTAAHLSKCIATLFIFLGKLLS